MFDMKPSLIRLPDWAEDKVKEMAYQKGLRYATAITMIVCEHLNESAPGATSAKIEPGAATTSAEPEVA